ncbi:MAG: tetratricopeptide repeat protein [Acidobacteria bacterium]|nr:tetratricopeptide repeat protein [Acidobacteriota bacterium]
MTDGEARLRLASADSPLAAAEWIENWQAEHEGGRVIASPPPAEWPFRYPLAPDLPEGPVIIRANAFDEALINQQSSGTQLVTTQRAYLEAEWAAALATHAGAWLLLVSTPAPQHPSTTALLPRAFRVTEAAERLSLCVEALREGRTAAALVATASVCMEVNDLEAAARDLDEAIALAPHWAAAHYEHGKLWLRRDDMPRAAAAFQVATDLLPRFAPAWSNLGATLGELDRPAEALAAFETALALDPANPQALNNVGVVRRELGRLTESESAFRQVIQLTPGLAFGHYNLGHTLFLQGRFQAALSAYAEGQARDPEKNPVQASRLALCQVATGDADGALRELRRATAGLPREYRQQLLADTSAILWALVTQQPGLAGWQPVQAWVDGELRGKSG